MSRKAILQNSDPGVIEGVFPGVEGRRGVLVDQLLDRLGRVSSEPSPLRDQDGPREKAVGRGEMLHVGVLTWELMKIRHFLWPRTHVAFAL